MQRGANSPWWQTGLQGIILVAIGLYLLLAPASAGGLILQLIALVLLVQSILQIAATVRHPATAAGLYLMLQAGIGATVGVVVALRGWLVPTLDTNAARTMLGLGLLAYSLVGLARVMVARGPSESWQSSVINALLLIVLALLLLTSGESNAVDRLAFLGWVALVGGALLLVLAWRTRGQEGAA